MKITVITGSPRKHGNSFAMTEAFIKAAEQRGHTIQRFDAAFMKIGGCHACMTCYKTGKACSFDDDFNLIAPAILESDAVVFSMPVYWYSIPAQIKKNSVTLWNWPWIRSIFVRNFSAESLPPL